MSRLPPPVSRLPPPASFDVVPSAPVAIARLIDWLRALPADLDRRAVVLVPTERIAHAIRRRVCALEGHPEWLAGVRLLPANALARDILTRAGRPALPDGEDVRRLRVHERFQLGTLPLRYFRAEQLRFGRGYVDAFVRTIDDLEASGLTAEDLAEVAGTLAASDPLAAARLLDVAQVWSAADAGGPARCTDSRLLQLAATVLAQTPEIAAGFGPAAALLLGDPNGSLLGFAAALAEVRMIFVDALPLRPGTQRWRVAAPAPARSGTAPADTGGSELRLLQNLLFTPPLVAGRPRSPGPDGSVDLDEHPGIEEEVDAAAIWVAEQVDRGVPAEEVALIVPEIEPYAGLIIDRLARIGDGALTVGGEVAVYVAGGVALAGTPAGVRLLTLLRAWQQSLNAEAVLPVLPALRPEGGDDAPARLSPSRAAELIYGAGIVGGSPGDPSGATEWLPRLDRRRRTLERIIADPDVGTIDEPDKQPHRWDRYEARRWLEDLVPLLPAIAALQGIGEQVVAAAPLTQLWPAMRQFVRDWYRLPPDPANLMTRMDDALAAVLGDAAAERVTGSSALDLLIAALHRERVGVGRFGEARIFVGKPAAAAGLEFTAVRVLGLAEGALPRTPHDDPIVPSVLRRKIEDGLRDRIPALALPLLEDRVLEDLHAFHRVVGATRERLALSAPRQWTERSEREVSGVMLEVVAALARPFTTPHGTASPGIATRLRAGYFVPGRVHREQFASSALPLPRSAQVGLPRRHENTLAVPGQWLQPPVVSLARMHALAEAGAAATVGAVDGLFSGVVGEPPGLSASRPLSATRLTALLTCPHRFLLERVLGWEEPSRRPATDTIDPLPYGKLFHAAAEAFFRDVGPPFCRREGTVDDWVARARAIASEKFNALREEYPLRGSETIERERRRLLEQIEQMVRHEWSMRSRSFFGAERAFGEPDAVALRIGERVLYVRGVIDRVDRAGGRISVRDFKTGRVRDFNEESMNAARDLQLGLYTLVLEAEPGVDGVVTHAAYVHPSAAHQPERAFRGAELEQLRVRTRTWLDSALDLLHGECFIRTPVASDCDFCPFRPACGEGAHARSAAKLAARAPEAAAAFVCMKAEAVHE